MWLTMGHLQVELQTTNTDFALSIFGPLVSYISQQVRDELLPDRSPACNGGAL